MVGWGGNNGSTLTAALIANRKKLFWEKREGTQTANFFGSLVLASTLRLGVDSQNKEVCVPFKEILPMVDPCNIVVGGWDISRMNLADSMDRAKVLDPDLKRQVRSEMERLVPLPSIYYPDFIAANQTDRADNVLKGTKAEHLAILRSDIR